jgi:hypothetical protein
MVELTIAQNVNPSRLKIKDGGSIFKMDIITTLITEANFTETNDMRFLTLEPGFLYIPALNLKNAQRKFSRELWLIDMEVSRRELSEQLHPSLIRGEGQIENNNTVTNTE